MLKLYLLLGTFVVVVIAIAVVLINQRKRRQGDSSGSDATDAKAPDQLPAILPEAAEFDPNATRIYLRPVSATEAVTAAERVQAELPAGANARLVCVGGSQKGAVFVIGSDSIMIGRGTGNTIVISDPRVSHHHAWVGMIDNKIILRDLGSTNGTFLNARSDSLVHEVALVPGDTIFFGGHGGDQFRLIVD